VDKDSKRLRKKKMKKMSVERSATEDHWDDEEIEAEVRQQADNVHVAVSLAEKAVCIQIHTGTYRAMIDCYLRQRRYAFDLVCLSNFEQYKPVGI